MLVMILECSSNTVTLRNALCIEVVAISLWKAFLKSLSKVYARCFLRCNGNWLVWVWVLHFWYCILNNFLSFKSYILMLHLLCYWGWLQMKLYKDQPTSYKCNIFIIKLVSWNFKKMTWFLMIICGYCSWWNILLIVLKEQSKAKRMHGHFYSPHWT